MKEIIGLIWGTIFILVTVGLVVFKGIGLGVIVAFLIVAILGGFIIAHSDRFIKLRYGKASLSLSEARNIKVESKKEMKSDPTTKYNPITIHSVETLSQEFKDFVVEIREKGNNSTLIRKTASGIKDGLIWRMQPLIFDHTEKGKEYEIRIYVQDIDGNKSPYTDWVSKIAGE